MLSEVLAPRPPRPPASSRSQWALPDLGSQLAQCIPVPHCELGGLWSGPGLGATPREFMACQRDWQRE